MYILLRTHPPDCNQDTSVRVEHEQEGQQQTEDEETQHIGDAGGWTEVPLDGARGAGSLGPVAAPTQEGRQGPEERVDPGSPDKEPGLPEVWDVDLGGVQHGGVALIGEDRQGHQGHNALKRRRWRKKDKKWSILTKTFSQWVH